MLPATSDVHLETFGRSGSNKFVWIGVIGSTNAYHCARQ